MKKHVLVVKGKPAAKYDSIDVAHENAPDSPYKVLSSLEDVKKLTKLAKMKIYHHLLLQDAEKNVSPDLLWKMLQEANLKDFRKKTPHHMGPSQRERLRKILEDGEEHHPIDLATQLKVSKVVVHTLISDLRSDNYCGKEGPLKIAKSEMGGYYLVRD